MVFGACNKLDNSLINMAEEVGFEPTEGFHLRRFSRPMPKLWKP